MIDVQADPAIYPIAVPLIPYLGIRMGQSARLIKRPITPAAFGIFTNFVPDRALTDGTMMVDKHSPNMSI